MTEIIVDGVKVIVEKVNKPPEPKRDRAWLVLVVGMPIIAAVLIYLNGLT